MSKDTNGAARRTGTGDRRKARLMAVGAGVLVALASWAVAEIAFGVDLREPTFGGAEQAKDMTAGPLVVASLVGGAAGWALLGLLEHFTARARQIWTGVATVALLASLAQPLSGQGVGADTKVTLVLMHLTVGGVLITLLRRSAVGHGGSPPAHRRP